MTEPDSHYQRILAILDGKRSPFTPKQRRAMRAEKWKDMRPHVFTAVTAMLPDVLCGVKSDD